MGSLQADITETEGAHVELRTDVDGVISQLDEAEHRISQLEDDNHRICQVADKNAKKCEVLHQAVEDAANRDRRQNLRLICLREKIENGEPSKMREEDYIQNFGSCSGLNSATTSAPSPGAVVRGGPTTQSDYYTVSEFPGAGAGLRGEYRDKEDIVLGGSKLSFFRDMTKETAEKRRKFKDVRSRLHELDVRFTLAYLCASHGKGIE